MAAVETAPPVGATKTRDPDDPVKFTIDQVKILTAPKSRRYWIGVYPDAPFDHGSKAGVSFMKYKGPPPVDDDGAFNPSKIQARGTVVSLTDAQVADFAAAVANVILRTGHAPSDSITPDGKPRSAFVVRKWMHLDSVEYDVQKDRKGEPQTKRVFEFTRDDVPLGYYLYCVPVREQMPSNWRDEKTPPRMCDTSSMVKAG